MSDAKRPAPDSRQGPFDTEIRTRVIVQFLVWMVIAVVVIVGGIRFLESRLEHQARQADEPPSPLVDRTQHRLPPEPRLQPVPQLDLQAYLAEERRRTSSWGWVDERTGVVHIPVQRAMEIVAARGLPARAQSAAGDAAGAAAPARAAAVPPAIPSGGQP